MEHLRVLDTERIGRLHRASLEVLATIGVRVPHAPVRLGVRPAAAEAAQRCDVLLRRRGSLRLPVRVFARTTAWRPLELTWDGPEDSLRLVYEGPQGLESVAIDPSHGLLLDDDLTNNARQGVRPHSARTVFERLLFAAEVVGVGVLP